MQKDFTIGVVKFFKVPLGGCFSTDFRPKVTNQVKANEPKDFLFGLNLELHSGLKVRGSEINFIKYKLVKSKNPRGFVIPTLKVRIFYMSNFCIIKLISDPLTLRPLCSSRLRSNKKCLVDQLLLA